MTSEKTVTPPAVRSRLLPALAIVLATLPALTPARGQEQEPLFNFVYATQLGPGVYSVGNRTVQVYPFPFTWDVRPQEGMDWGYTLRFPVAFGLTDFDLANVEDLTSFFDDTGQVIDENLTTVVFMPGVEFQLPVTERWVLKPIAELGLGAELSGGDVTWTYSAAVRSLYQFPWSKRELFLGNEVRYAGNTPTGGGDSFGFVVLKSGLDLRHPLGKGEKGWFLSTFVTHSLFLDQLEFVELDDEVNITQLYEVGLAFGRKDPFKLWVLRFPQLGLTYRFGDDLRAIYINFGFPF